MNENYIKDFSTTLRAQAIGERRIKKYQVLLKILSKHLKKDFKRVDYDDLIDLFSKLESGKIKSMKGKEYAEDTKRDFRITTRKFWKWLKKTEDYPKEVKWIKTSQNRRLERKIKIKDVPSEEETYRMVDTAMHTRDKAIISLMFETGSRIGEILKLKKSDIVFDERGYYFQSCLGKTGEIYKRVVNFKAVELLKNWFNEHPLKDDDAPLWITLVRSHTGMKGLGESGFRKMLREVGGIAGITKRVNPNSFRHGRITDLRLKKKVPDAITEMLVGWKPGSNRFDVYQHAKSEDVDKALGDAYGVKEKQREDASLNKMEKLLATDDEFRKKIVKLMFEKGIKI